MVAAAALLLQLSIYAAVSHSITFSNKGVGKELFTILYSSSAASLILSGSLLSTTNINP